MESPHRRIRELIHRFLDARAQTCTFVSLNRIVRLLSIM